MLKQVVVKYQPHQYFDVCVNMFCANMDQEIEHKNNTRNVNMHIPNMPTSLSTILMIRLKMEQCSPSCLHKTVHWFTQTALDIYLSSINHA